VTKNVTQDAEISCKDDRNNYSTAAIEVTKNVTQHAEISCTHMEQVVQSSCDASTEHHVNPIDNASNDLSMLAQGVQSDGNAVQVKGQHSNIFQSQCKIQDKVCKLLLMVIVLQMLLVQI
jgi:flagellar basal body rod protein FlgB